MGSIVRTALGVVLGLFAGSRAAAAATGDVSLAREVEQYLQSAQGGAGDMTFKVFWKDGINLETGDKAFTAKIGGRLMADFVWNDADDEYTADVEHPEDAVRFRRVRLHAQGTMYKNLEFSIELDFASGSAELRDVFVGLKKVPGAGNVRVGHFKEPIGLEELTSSRNITFMERSTPISAFVPAFNTGFALFRNFLEGDRILVNVGFFKNTSESGGAVEEDGAYALTFRVTGLAVENKEKRFLVHLGFGFRHHDPNGETVRIRVRPSVSTGARPVDTGNLAGTDRQSVFGFELLVIYGPLSFQGEYLFSDLDNATAGDPQFSGFYVMVSYWLTGESRPYSHGKGTPDRVKPKRNFHDGGGGMGAWEVAFRLSSIDLTDGAVTGGEMLDYVFGVNWHLNPNARVMFNVVFGEPEDQGSLTVFQMRFQADF